MQLIIYTPTITPRISYAFSLFFDSLLPTSYKLTSDINEYKNYNGYKLNYSGAAISQGEVFIGATTLLTETGIKPQSITVTEWEGLKVFFQTNLGALPFDVFAASFYLVTRYEEYLPFTPDKHGRFQPVESLAFKNGFLDTPLVNFWAQKLESLLKEAFPGIEIKKNEYRFTPTIDVDVAYAHKGRKLAVTWGAYFKALTRFDFAYMARKTAVLLGGKPDEYDTYDYQREVFDKHGVKPKYFILAGTRGEYDKNILTDSNCFAELIKKLSDYAEVGIHPSYQSGNKSEIVKHEIAVVEKHCKKKVTFSRQHFLRISLPETYQCLQASGITDDYSTGYAAQPGFRASICTPFKFYDLKNEMVLSITLHPTIIMDGTLNEYICLSPDNAKSLAAKLIDVTKKCNGEFVAIWHNDTLNNKGKWAGWRNVFEEIIVAAK